MAVAALLPFLGPVSELAKSILDKIWPPQADPNLKMQAQHEIEMMLQQRENALVNATQEIIVAEMNQGDSYTKRARPSLVYAGLFFIFMVHVGFPIAAFFSGRPMPQGLSLPEEFWWAWSGVVGIWSLGRTFERKGIGGKVTEAITGK